MTPDQIGMTQSWLDTTLTWASSNMAIILLIVIIAFLLMIPLIKIMMEQDNFALMLAVVICSTIFFFLLIFGLYKGSIDMPSMTELANNTMQNIRQVTS